jgi:uncharacterized protein
MIITQSDIIEAIISQAAERPDLPVQSTVCGAHMLAVMNEENAGLCSRLPGTIHAPESAPDNSVSVHTMIKGLKLQNTDHASWGLAAINSVLNRKTAGPEVKVQDLILSFGRDRNVAIIGHFPFVEQIRENFKNFWVLELSPRGTDIPESMKSEVLPRADLVAITATTLLNDSLGEILNLTSKKAIKIMLGPSTPQAACLFEMGFDYLGGAVVQDRTRAAYGISKGLPFRKLDGVGYTLISRNQSPAGG